MLTQRGTDLELPDSLQPGFHLSKWPGCLPDGLIPSPARAVLGQSAGTMPMPDFDRYPRSRTDKSRLNRYPDPRRTNLEIQS